MYFHARYGRWEGKRVLEFGCGSPAITHSDIVLRRQDAATDSVDFERWRTMSPARSQVCRRVCDSPGPSRPVWRNRSDPGAALASGRATLSVVAGRTRPGIH